MWRPRRQQILALVAKLLLQPSNVKRNIKSGTVWTLLQCSIYYRIILNQRQQQFLQETTRILPKCSDLSASSTLKDTRLGLKLRMRQWTGPFHSRKRLRRRKLSRMLKFWNFNWPKWKPNWPNFKIMILRPLTLTARINPPTRQMMYSRNLK